MSLFLSLSFSLIYLLSLSISFSWMLLHNCYWPWQFDMLQLYLFVVVVRKAGAGQSRAKQSKTHNHKKIYCCCLWATELTDLSFFSLQIFIHQQKRVKLRRRMHQNRLQSSKQNHQPLSRHEKVKSSLTQSAFSTSLRIEQTNKKQFAVP